MPPRPFVCVHWLGRDIQRHYQTKVLVSRSGTTRNLRLPQLLSLIPHGNPNVLKQTVAG